MHIACIIGFLIMQFECDSMQIFTLLVSRPTTSTQIDFINMNLNASY